jgi:uncharacterized protein YuzE
VNPLALQAESCKGRKMRITFDGEAEASYIYFTTIEPGGAVQSIVDLRLDVGLDKDEMITTMQLFESKDCRFEGRLQFALQNRQVSYDPETKSVMIDFTTGPEPTKIISWEANIDLDREGKILGVEILFAEPDYRPDDGRERLYAKGKLDHLSKYIVPFDALH